MNLIAGNNLYDVYDIILARKNLMMKDIVYQNSNSVNIVGGSISIESLILKYHEDQTSYIRCDEEGHIILDNNILIPRWLRKNLGDIPTSIFSNDIDIVYKNDIHTSAYTNNVYDMGNVPSLSSNIHTLENIENIAFSHSNLLDILDIDRFYEKISLHTYSKCNLVEEMTFANVLLENINFPNYNEEGYISSCNNIDILLNVNNSIANSFGYKMITNNPINVFDVPTSEVLNQYFFSLYHDYLDKNSVYTCNVAIVVDFIQRNKDKYVNHFDHLQFLNSNSVLNHLYLTNFVNHIKVDNNILDIDSNVNLISYGAYSKIYFDFLNNKNVPTNTLEFIYYNTSNTLDVFFKSQFEIAENSTKGIIYLTNDVYTSLDNPLNVQGQSTSYSLRDFKAITESHFEDLNNIEILQTFQRFLEELSSFGIDNGSNMMKFSCNLEEISHFSQDRFIKCYKNLGLKKVAYSLDYYDIFNKPFSLLCFSNDMKFMSSFNSLNEIDDVFYARSNLFINTLGVQNIENVDIIGSNLNLDFLRINNTFTYNLDAHSNQFLKANSDGIGNFEYLYEYSDESPKINGIVRMYNRLQYDENATYTIELLHTIYNELSSNIGVLRSNIEQIKMLIN